MQPYQAKPSLRPTGLANSSRKRRPLKKIPQVPFTSLSTIVEEEISVKTLYNSGSEGWATFGDLGQIFVGTLLGSVMFTCDVFFEFVACLSGLVPSGYSVADLGLPRVAFQ